MKVISIYRRMLAQDAETLATSDGLDWDEMPTDQKQDYIDKAHENYRAKAMDAAMDREEM